MASCASISSISRSAPPAACTLVLNALWLMPLKTAVGAPWAQALFILLTRSRILLVGIDIEPPKAEWDDKAKKTRFGTARIIAHFSAMAANTMDFSAFYAAIRVF